MTDCEEARRICSTPPLLSFSRKAAYHITRRRWLMSDLQLPSTSRPSGKKSLIVNPHFSRHSSPRQVSQLDEQVSRATRTPLTIPNHRLLKGSTLRTILTQAGIARDEFLDAYDRT